ncbi:MAG TPA: tol-pal system-associated acyl-CoA thioesterase [Gammaproteobacteria bacterium]|nr:tol-pal system-associated acyl-CoA thioesterase [Gammaproteobacteria bacterium]
MNDNPSPFIWPIRVYYEDTDSGGVVYHANYLRFMERARTECLRARGFEQDRLREEQGVLFTVHSMNVRYRAPARFNDRLEVSARISALGRARLDFYQEIRRPGESRILCEAEVRVACVDAAHFRPRAIPQPVKEALGDVG